MTYLLRRVKHYAHKLTTVTTILTVNLPKGGHHLFGEAVYFLFALWPTADDELKSHVLYTDVLKLLQASDQLLGSTFKVLVAFRHRLVCKINRAATTEVRRLWSTQLGPPFFDFGVLCSHILGRNLHVIGEPGIGVFCRTPHCGFAFSTDRKSTRLNSSHRTISYAVFCLKK